ncbi:MAG: 5-(carboxyamino)imidazole ribonucleotide mutase [Alphaproteobacteria bacterium]|nr:MAG: 5-(carboxyamino)imidazole ribonucleotide mutase [Alphaproteobacteria bacterium]
MRENKPVVGVIMGSQSDWSVMKETIKILEQLEIPCEAKIISAHRTPKRLSDYVEGAEARGMKIIIAGAGGAAHLAGVTAALTTLPVLGVPMESQALKGMDSLLSIVQMPGGIPVGTLAIGKAGAKNAGLLAAAIIALFDDGVAQRLTAWREQQAQSIAFEPVDS